MGVAVRAFDVPKRLPETTPGRVFPGKKMAGRLGGKQTQVKNLTVVYINEENNLLVVKGSVPGKTGNLLSIK